MGVHRGRGPLITTKRIFYVVVTLHIIGYFLFFPTSPLLQQQEQEQQQHYRTTGNNYAYITFANNDNYAKGAIALAVSLLQTGSIYPLIVMVTKEVSHSIRISLENLGCIIHHTELIKLPPELSLQTERWGPAFTKLVAWKKIAYNKLMFLDSDLLILQNVDDLFESQHELLATLDADASSCMYKPERLELINSGVLVLTPSMTTYNALITTLHNSTLLATGNINDQDVIIHTMKWNKLGYPQYGAQVTHCECNDGRLWDPNNIKIIHFTAGLKKLPKPWNYKKGSKGMPKCVIDLYEIWQGYYNIAIDIH